jgi:hypothetical protein
MSHVERRTALLIIFLRFQATFLFVSEALMFFSSHIHVVAMTALGLLVDTLRFVLRRCRYAPFIGIFVAVVAIISAIYTVAEIKPDGLMGQNIGPFQSGSRYFLAIVAANGAPFLGGLLAALILVQISMFLGLSNEWSPHLFHHYDRHTPSATEADDRWWRPFVTMLCVLGICSGAVAVLIFVSVPSRNPILVYGSSVGRVSLAVEFFFVGSVTYLLALAAWITLAARQWLRSRVDTNTSDKSS